MKRVQGPEQEKSIGSDTFSQVVSLLKSSSDKLLQALLQTSETLGTKSYVVGGTVRDCLLGRFPADLDLTVAGDVTVFAKALQRELGGGTLVDLSGPEDEAVRVVFQGEQVDVSAFRDGAQSIEEDLMLRDFTVNAMAVDLRTLVGDGDSSPGNILDHILDPTGGQNDLQAGLVRHCPGAFEADPLRLLRGYRLMAGFGFSLIEETKEAIGKRAAAIQDVAAERINHELHLIFKSARTASTLEAMAEAGLLRFLLPELYLGEGVEQPEFHHLDVMDHCFLALSTMETIIAEPDRFFPGLGNEFADYLDSEHLVPCLKWAALLHDIGKPATKKRRPGDGRVTFYCHEDEGRDLFRQYADRLKWSRADSERVGGLIGMHMHPFHLCNVQRESKKISKKAALKLCQRAGDDLFGLFMLAMSDSLASRGEKKPERMEEELVDLCKTVLQLYREHIAPVLQGPRLLTGKDLIEEFNLTPGPLFSTILEDLEVAQVEGQVSDRESAFIWLHQYLQKMDGQSTSR